MAARRPAAPEPMTNTLETFVRFMALTHILSIRRARPAFGDRPQPQRDALRLHRLPDQGGKVVTQSVEVRLVSQSGRECFEGLPRIVLLPVEATIDKRLHAPPQRVEQRRYRQRRGDYGKLVFLTDNRGQESLETGHAPEVYERKRRREGAVDEG